MVTLMGLRIVCRPACGATNKVVGRGLTMLRRHGSRGAMILYERR